MKRKLNRKRWFEVLGVVMAVLVAAATWAGAQGGGVMYYACVNNASGTIHMIGAGETCANNEELVTWNSEGPQGIPGLDCWDLDGDGLGDAEEDLNGDGLWDTQDCQGPQGEVGPAGPQGDVGPAGLACWDLDGDGAGDPEEDANGDELWDAQDCQGAQGQAGWSLTGNAGTTPGTSYLGTSDDQALELKVNGGRALRLEPNATSPNVLGGSGANWVAEGVYGATVAGGGDTGHPNSVTDNYGTVGGGYGNDTGNGTALFGEYATVGGGMNNAAEGTYSTVGGGAYNLALGESAAVGGGRQNYAGGSYSTVGGGQSNAASGGSSTVGGGYDNTAQGLRSTVGGGETNTASGSRSTVGGGMNNTASGGWSTVPGGYQSTAAGSYSLAAGMRAKANNAGCFVWGDSTYADVTCDTDNAWVARATGGVTFYTSADLSTGVTVPAGGGAWSTVSDRNLKENLAAVDAEELLARLAQVPVSTWNYISQDASIRHMGPMAQDFYAAFGLGEEDTRISTVDADGVALAAIQGLYAENQALKAENARQQAQIDALDARLTALEGAGPAAQPAARPEATLPWLLAGGLVLAGGTWGVTRRRGN